MDYLYVAALVPFCDVFPLEVENIYQLIYEFCHF